MYTELSGTVSTTGHKRSISKEIKAEQNLSNKASVLMDYNQQGPINSPHIGFPKCL